MAANNPFKDNKNRLILFSILFFIIISFTYFSPVMSGKRIIPGDTARATAMAKEARDYRSETSIEPNWTNSMFGGMPTYLISTKYKSSVLTWIYQAYYKIPLPVSFLLLNFLLFFLLLMAFNVRVLVSCVGALAFGLNSAFFVWIESGHLSKANTITFIALVVMGVILAYRKSSWKGALITALGLAFMLEANHPQMTYYAGIMVLIIGITYLVYAIKEKTLPSFLKTSALLIMAAILALGTSFSRLYTIYEYGKYSIRGESELTTTDEDKTAGLDKSYILDYSYDLGETMTAFIPRFKGGGMSEPLGENSNFYKELEKMQGKKRAKEIAENAPLYWGSQPISGAPFYYGAVLIFLFVFGLFTVKGKERWWIIATVIVSFLLSMGKYLPGLAHFMIDHFPGYNKFRDVKNIIVIQQFAMALLGVLAVKELYTGKHDKKVLLKNLKWAFGITGGLALIFAVIPGLAGDFVGQTDARYAQSGWPQQLINALQLDRKEVLRADAFRSFIFVALAAAGIWAYVTQKLKAKYALAFWAVLIMADMWPINKKYLNNDDFVSKRKAESPYTASAADNEILKDNSLDYRVLNITVNPWSDASTSYFHKSIGGYHGAKMQRYQELIEYHLSPEVGQLQNRLRNITSQADVDKVFDGLNAINMMNTKYIIYNPQAAPLQNNQAVGNAWFVNNVEVVESPDAEINKINELDIQTTAVVDQQFKELLPVNLVADSTASIVLETYAPNKLVYKTTSTKEQLAVFSEIYYPKGWVATIDGNELPILRANYVLRAAAIPAGNH